MFLGIIAGIAGIAAVVNLYPACMMYHQGVAYQEMEDEYDWPDSRTITGNIQIALMSYVMAPIMWPMILDFTLRTWFGSPGWKTKKF